MSTYSKVDEARKWVDSLTTRWRLQVLSKRYKTDPKTGAQVETPLRIRRFVEGVPWSLVNDSMKYLLSLAPYKGIVYNGVELEGEYRPTLTTWKRDDYDTTVSGSPRAKPDGTYTLVQDLIDVREKDTQSAGTGLSCSEETITEWHWDDPEIEDLPHPAEQGVTYLITNVSRDDSGTFSYALVKRVSRTQHMPESVSSDTSVETKWVETWNNVYGEPGAFVDQDGNDVGVPAAGVTDSGVVTVQVSENDDCTYRIVAERARSKQAEARRMTEVDQYQARELTATYGDEHPLDDAPEPSGGVMHQHDSKLNPDGTYENTTTIDTELPVARSRVEVVVGRKGRRETVVDTNQPEPADTDGVPVGSHVTVEKTKGKLFTNTVSRWVRGLLGTVGEMCRIDLFKRVDRVTRSGEESIPDSCVTGSGVGGVVKTRTTEMDDDGAITQTLETEREKEVLKSRETWSIGLRGKRHLVENRHVDAPAPEPSSIGTRVVNERTPGGLWNTTVDELDRDFDDVDTAGTCEKTVFEHADTTAVLTSDGTVSGSHALDPGLADAPDGTQHGHHYKVSETVQDDGSVTVQTTHVEEVPVQASDVVYRRTAKAIITQVTDRNVADVAVAPTNIGETQQHTTNPGGSHNVTRTTLTLTEKPDRAHCSRTVFEHQHDNVATAVSDSPDSSDASQPGVDKDGHGHYYVKDSVVDSDGVVTTTERDVDEIPVSKSEVQYRKTLRGLITTVVDKNQSSSVPVPVTVGCVNSSRMNPGGSYDNTTQTRTAAAEPDSSYCSKNVFLHVHDVVSMQEGLSGSEDPHSGCGDAGSGTYYLKTQDTDSDGFVKTVLRKYREKRQDNGTNGAANAHYTSNIVSIRNNSVSAPTPSFSAGHQTQYVTSRMTDGGSYDTTVETRTPGPYNSDSIDIVTNMSEWHAVYFFNATSSNIESLAHSLNKTYATDTRWATSHFDARVTMNEFALFDGMLSETVTKNTSLMNQGEKGSYSFTTSEVSIQPHWWRNVVSFVSCCRRTYVTKVSTGVSSLPPNVSTSDTASQVTTSCHVSWSWSTGAYTITTVDLTSVSFWAQKITFEDGQTCVISLNGR